MQMYDKAKTLVLLRQLIGGLPIFSHLRGDERRFWRTVGQTSSDIVMKRFFAAVAQEIFPITMNEAEIVLRVRLEYAYDFIEKLDDDFQYSLPILCKYLAEITTGVWQTNGFTWLVEEKAGIRLWWKATDNQDEHS